MTPAPVIDLPSEAATMKVGERLAPLLSPGDIIALDGPLGAGKTTFARGLIRAFAGVADVPSPTFPLVETYQGRDADLWHFDLYRLEAPGDVWELGLEDALADGVCLIEWPDRIGADLLGGALWLRFTLEGGARQLSLAAPAPWRRRLHAAGLM